MPAHLRPATLTQSLVLILAALLCPGHASAATDAGVKPDASSKLDAASAPQFQPAIDDLFSGAEEYRKVVDRFFVVAEQMDSMRAKFSKASQAVLQALTTTRSDARGCPAAEVAPPYFQAQDIGAKYLQKGRELTRHHERIRDYDGLQETLSLVPVYKLKVKRAYERYKQLLRDYREMRAIFHEQLANELRYRGCTKIVLDPYRKSAAEWVASEPIDQPEKVTVETPVDGGAPLPPVRKGGAPVIQPSRPVAVAFFIDNLRCTEKVTVVLDGMNLGEVGSKSRQTFFTQSGQHDLCLLHDDSQKCGEAGTVRKVYLYDGWTITLRCE